MSVLLEADAVSLQRGSHMLVQGLDLQLKAGQRLAILGKNGAGKSTLLHALAGLIAPQSGQITLAGRPYREIPPRQAAQIRGLLPQHPAAPGPYRVLEIALMGRHPHRSRWTPETLEDLQRAQDALAQLGLAEHARQPAARLSGGERQRLAIATLLTQAPRLLLLDEPLTHIDPGAQRVLLEVLLNAAARGAVVAVMHDPTLAHRLFSHALLLFEGGRWQTGPVADVLTADRLSQLYGHPFRGLQDGEHRIFLPS
jgi:iron complex transport system ATP-binding protein